MKNVINVTILGAIFIVVPNSVSGLFWDFTRPTDNAGQAALGGAFLGASGALTVCWLKGNCGSRNRGKRDTDTTKNVSSIICKIPQRYNI